MLEAGVRQFREWGNGAAGRHILIAVARYLAAHSPTERARAADGGHCAPADARRRTACGDGDGAMIRSAGTPGWKLVGFGSKEEAEAYKARARAQYGRSVSFPWDGYSG